MGLLCAPTLQSTEKQYLKVVEDCLEKISRHEEHLEQRMNILIAHLLP